MSYKPWVPDGSATAVSVPAANRPYADAANDQSKVTSANAPPGESSATATIAKRPVLIFIFRFEHARLVPFAAELFVYCFVSFTEMWIVEKARYAQICGIPNPKSFPIRKI
jgi:hypothetical protein